jgi:hypothetical protein
LFDVTLETKTAKDQWINHHWLQCFDTPLIKPEQAMLSRTKLGSEIFHFLCFGPSGVSALPLAAGINKGGQFFLDIIPLVGVVGTTTIQNHGMGCRSATKYHEY